MEARATSYNHQILRPSRSVDDKAVLAARGPRRRSGSEESEVARAAAVGGRVSGFLSREVVEYVCGVGFIR